MTCKDCVHYDVCQELRYGDISNCNSKDCGRHFKNKANFVEVEQGEWIKFTLGDFDFVDRYKCSVCKNIIEPFPKNINVFQYCPYCGAKMKGGADNG